MKEPASHLTHLLQKQDFFEDSTLPLHVNVRDPQPPFPKHSHAFDELVIILKGTALHVVDEHEFPVRSGDVFVISEHHEHEYRERHGLVLANILFDAEALLMHRWDIRALPGFHALFSLEPVLRTQHNVGGRLQLSERELVAVNGLIRDLTAEMTQRNPGYRVMARALFMQLAVYLSRAYSTDPTEESIDLLRIGDAIAHIESRYRERITLAELARKSHLSQRHFTRIFQQCVGRAPIDHLMQVRLQRAAELLTHSERTITDIAYDCGFSDSNYFTRCFRKAMGQPPSQYRRR